MKSVKTVEAKFLRSKTDAKQTSLWKNTPDDLKSIVLKKVSFNAGEEPIIIFYKKAHFWWLLTTVRLLIFDNNKISIINISIINISEIQKVELKKIIEGQVSKEECSSVQLFIRNDYFDLQVEPKTWSIMFLILGFMIC